MFFKRVKPFYTPVSQTQANPPQANPQAKEVLKSMSPSKQDPENHLPKQISRKIHPQAKKKIKIPNKHHNRTSIDKKKKALAHPKLNPSKPQANPMESCFLNPEIQNTLSVKIKSVEID